MRMARSSTWPCIVSAHQYLLCCMYTRGAQNQHPGSWNRSLLSLAVLGSYPFWQSLHCIQVALYDEDITISIATGVIHMFERNMVWSGRTSMEIYISRKKHKFFVGFIFRLLDIIWKMKWLKAHVLTRIIIKVTHEWVTTITYQNKKHILLLGNSYFGYYHSSLVLGYETGGNCVCNPMI